MGCFFFEVFVFEDVDMVIDVFFILLCEVVDFKRWLWIFFDRVFGVFGREKVFIWLGIVFSFLCVFDFEWCVEVVILYLYVIDIL